MKVEPAVPAVTLADLVSPRSALVITVSVSWAGHTPAKVHEGDGLLFTTLAGGVIVATLVTDVWASAGTEAKNKALRNSQANRASMARAVGNFSRDKHPPAGGPNTVKTLVPQLLLQDPFTRSYTVTPSLVHRKGL